MDRGPHDTAAPSSWSPGKDELARKDWYIEDGLWQPLVVGDGPEPSRDAAGAEPSGFSSMNKDQAALFPLTSHLPGAKLPTCEDCGRSFIRISELKKHRKRHTKPFRCEVEGCIGEKGFGSRNDLERHMRSFHPTLGESSTLGLKLHYSCTLGLCKNKPKVWPRKDHFRQHLKRVHKLDVDVDDDLNEFLHTKESLSDAPGNLDDKVDSKRENPYLLHLQKETTRKDIHPQNETRSRSGVPQTLPPPTHIEVVTDSGYGSSQHLQPEIWKCNVMSSSNEVCDKGYSRHETFEYHLRQDHDIRSAKIIEQRREECRVNRHHETSFWCGFCRAVININQKGLEAWTERFDHIHDHMIGRNGWDKMEISQWHSAEMNLPTSLASGESHFSSSSNTSAPTTYSDTTSLRDSKLDDYAIAFANELSRALPADFSQNDLEDIFNLLPTLLEAFASQIAYETPQRLQLQVKYLVHRSRL